MLKKVFRIYFPAFLLGMVILLEVFVFNFSSFHIMGKGYEESSLSLSDATVQGGVQTIDGNIEASENILKLEWTDINKPVGTVCLDFELEDAYSVEVQIDASDDTNSNYRKSIATKKMTESDKRSNTVILRMSGNVHNLCLSITIPDGGTFLLQRVTVNTPVDFGFSLLRVGLLFFVGIFVWYYLTNKAMQLPCSSNKRKFNFICNSITIGCLGFAVLMVGLYASDHSNGFGSEFCLTSGNQLTQELVDAFKHKQLHLLTQPSAELLEMENPYDWSARIKLGVSYLWDHCLYNGKYYSYYGIAPVLLLFLPYHLLTGYYFSTIFAILIFGCVGIIFLSGVYKLFINKFFPDLPLRLSVFGLLIFHMSSGIWYCFCAMKFYEIAQSAGFCFTVMGVYYLLKSNVIGKGHISVIRVAAGTTCLSLAVLSRPTTVVYCIVALIVIGLGLKKLICSQKNSSLGVIGFASKSKRNVVAYLFASFLPFVILGGLQMIYNYLRFDSFFDFGIQYSLTINDFTQSQFYMRFVSIGLYNYLFAAPIVTPEFPYVESAFQMLEANGYYFVANKYAVGIIWRVPPVLGLLFAPKALRLMKKENRLTAIMTVGSFSVIAPFIVLFSIWESGYGVRYAIDFTWEMIIGALAIVFFLYETGKNSGLRNYSSKIALLSVLPTAVINFALIYVFFMNEVNSPIANFIYNYLDSIFNFWF